MVNVFITGRFLNGKRYLPVLYPHLGELVNKKRLFADLGNRAFNAPAFNLVKNIKDADFILLPHEYFDVIKTDMKYLDEHLFLAREHNKKLLIFDLSDFTDKEINISEAIIFRIAEYKHRKKDNVIVMPTFIEDLSQYARIEYSKKKVIPIVGFCGFAEFKNNWQNLKFLIKIFFINIKKIITFNKNIESHKHGIYFRKKVIRVLKKCDKMEKRFIVRKSYSSHESTIELPVKEARKQYIENIIDSDFSLAVRGNANISCRFYEILSLGRVPLFVDTDCVLPLEDMIDYKKFVLFVDYKNMTDICAIVNRFYSEIDNDEFVRMQKTARDVYEKYLNTKSFLKYILSKLLEKNNEYKK